MGRMRWWSGGPGNVQNSYATALERGPSVTDQRNRFVAAGSLQPKFQLQSRRD